MPTTKHKLARLGASLLDSVRAIIWGSFFTSSLQAHLSTLHSMRAALQRLNSIERDLQALQLKATADADWERDIVEHLNVVEQKLGKFEKESRWLPAFSIADGQNAPEERLIEFLLPWLVERTVIDVGAHRGRFTAHMGSIGFERIFAFEPHPGLSQDLSLAHQNSSAIQIFPFAVSDVDGTAELHLAKLNSAAKLNTDPLLFSALRTHNMPPGLDFGESVPVATRSLHSLVKEGLLPPRAGLLKVDAEGHDFAVLKGMPSGTPYEIVMHEFWSNDFVFASPEFPSQEEIVRFMRTQGYAFSISLVRFSAGELKFTVNMPNRDTNTWGNTLYLRERDLFENAYAFMRSTMSQTV